MSRARSFLALPRTARAHWLFSLLLVACTPASAHIKWFAEVQVRDAPRPVVAMIGQPGFVALAACALLTMMLVASTEAWLRRRTVGVPGRALHGVVSDRIALRVIRIGTGLFFLANALYFADKPVLLTPELTAGAPWTTVLQVATGALALLGRPRLAAMGLVALFGQAIAQYGAFHLIDYTLFLGVAACLWLSDAPAALQRRALTALRLTVGLSLLWGAIEKWMYPQWTFPLLCGDARALLMGLTPDFFMQGAGMIEFCTATAIVVGAVAGRLACVLLLALMIAAMPMFGPIDVIGHAPFVLGLAVLACVRNGVADRFGTADTHRHVLRWAMAFGAMLATLPALYVAAHGLLIEAGDWTWLPLSVALPGVLLVAWPLTPRSPIHWRRPPPAAWKPTRSPQVGWAASRQGG